MTLVREFNLYLTAGRSIPLVINVNQFDSGEQWAFTIYKEDGTQYIPSTGAIVGIKSDNLGIINSGTVDENGRVIITETQQMTASVGKAVFELTLDSGTHGTANFVVLVEEKPGNNADLSDSDISLIQEALNAVSPLPTGGTVGQVLTKTAQGSAWSNAGTPTQEQVAEAVSDWADEHITVETGVVIDTSLSVAGAAADAKATGDEISELKSQINNGYTIPNYVEDKNLDSTTGALVDETGTCTSDFIPYTWTGSVSYDCGDNTKLTYRIEFYDSSKNHLQGFRNPSSTGDYTYRGINAEQQVTGTVGYVRFSFKKGTTGRIFTTNTTIWVASLTVVRGLRQMIGDLDDLETTDKDSLVDAINEVNGKISDIGDLSELDTTEKSNLVDAINEVNDKITDVTLPIKPSDTNFFYTSPNLADPSAFVADEYVNQTNGAFTPGTNYTRTGFIPVTAGKTYCIVNNADFDAGIRYVFYSSASTDAYISGANVNLSDIANLVTAPTNATHMVMSARTERFPFMVAESNTKADYVEYGITYLLPEYVLGEDVFDIPINLPSKIYALVGYELNIYFENIVEDWTQFSFDVTCSKGMQLERGYRITPASSDVGSYPLSIVISSKDGRSSKAVTTTLVIASASAGSGVTEKVLVLGDSTTNSGYAVTKLAQNLADDPMGITLLGTRGTSPYFHEGRSGWTFNLYFTSAGSGSVLNPFYNPNTQTFDASYYFANTGVSVPDWFFINLGINDVFNYTTDSALESAIPNIKGLCDDMIASVKAVSANIKIGLCITIPPNHSQDAFGKAYDCGQTRNRYKRNNVLWVNELIKEYDERESESIYLIPIYTNLDTIYNMGMETIPVNARNTSVTYESPIGNGGVHPVEVGYWQIADVYTAFLKANA